MLENMIKRIKKYNYYKHKEDKQMGTESYTTFKRIYLNPHKVLEIYSCSIKKSQMKWLVPWTLIVDSVIGLYFNIHLLSNSLYDISKYIFKTECNLSGY